MTEEELKNVQGCSNCIYNETKNTPENKCFPKPGELEFCFCNFQRKTKK